MNIARFDNEEDWLEARKGRITGTRAGNLLSKKSKEPLKGFWEIAVEKMAIPASDENRMDRGKRLEEYAVERFASETNKKVIYDKVLCYRDDEPDIAYSPDALIEGERASVEVKCLNSASHLQALLTGKIPSEYEEQSIQPFVVNDDLQTLYFVFYDPNFVKDFFFFTINKGEIAEKVTNQLAEQRGILERIREIEKQLTF